MRHDDVVFLKIPPDIQQGPLNISYRNHFKTCLFRVFLIDLLLSQLASLAPFCSIPLEYKQTGAISGFISVQHHEVSSFCINSSNEIIFNAI